MRKETIEDSPVKSSLKCFPDLAKSETSLQTSFMTSKNPPVPSMVTEVHKNEELCFIRIKENQLNPPQNVDLVSFPSCRRSLEHHIRYVNHQVENRMSPHICEPDVIDVTSGHGRLTSQNHDGKPVMQCHISSSAHRHSGEKARTKIMLIIKNY
ncbi:hypothetical protein FGO68_gene5877 [Halteria grandinella]|uniref:Uncharacterized protein n=1 Tax=Halteria grandinella TaxID=5974 RepID=A0A8J8N9H2_HALGN|nr:hypothetical protein FGO68_gene5877 [Halteria grandinella]